MRKVKSKRRTVQAEEPGKSSKPERGKRKRDRN